MGFILNFIAFSVVIFIAIKIFREAVLLLMNSKFFGSYKIDGRSVDTLGCRK